METTKVCVACGNKVFHKAFTCPCGYDFNTKRMPDGSKPKPKKAVVVPPPEVVPTVVSTFQIASVVEPVARLMKPERAGVVTAPALGQFRKKPAWLGYSGDGSDESLLAWIDGLREGWLRDCSGWLSNGAVVTVALSVCPVHVCKVKELAK